MAIAGKSLGIATPGGWPEFHRAAGILQQVEVGLEPDPFAAAKLPGTGSRVVDHQQAPAVSRGHARPDSRFRRPASGDGFVTVFPGTGPFRGKPGPDSLLARPDADRKSTRLNSSH